MGTCLGAGGLVVKGDCMSSRDSKFLLLRMPLSFLCFTVALLKTLLNVLACELIATRSLRILDLKYTTVRQGVGNRSPTFAKFHSFK